MSTFWVIAAVIALAVIVGLIMPILRRPPEAAKRADYDINVFKDQLVELEREAAEGRIGERELEAARLEIQRRLLAADTGGEEPNKTDRKGDRIPVIAAAVAVPVLAAVLYLELGSPGTSAYPFADRDPSQQTVSAGAASPHQSQGGAPMSQALQSLEARLQANPADIDGWILLARSYAGTGDLRKAAAAYEKALPLADRHPMLLADWAETALMARDGNFTEEIFNAFVEARDKDATLAKPWFYIGLDKAMGGKLEEAAQTWTDLITIHGSDPEFVRSVKAQIDRAASQGGFDATAIKPTDTAVRLAARVASSSHAEDTQSAAAPQASAPPGPTQEDVQAAQEMSQEDRSAFIRSMVQQLAEKLEANPNDPGGWQRLIRAYEVLGESDKAAVARERAKAYQ